MKTIMTDNTEEELAEQNPEPAGCPVAELLQEMEDAVSNTRPYLAVMQTAAEVRHCLWDGQSDDGRKHAEDLGREAFPYEGASDARVRVCEEVGREHWLVLMAATFRGKASFQARQLTEESRTSAHKLEQVMKYYLSGPMRREVRTVLALAFDWMLFYGLSVIHTGWYERRQLKRARLTASDLVEWAMQQGTQEVGDEMAMMEESGEQMDPAAQEALAVAVPAALQQLQERVMLMLTMNLPEARAELEALLRQYDPQMQNPKRVVRLLQKSGEADYFTAEVVESRPSWEALLPGVDILFPPETKDLQRARWVVRVRWLTRSEVLAAAKMEGWEEDWTEAVLGRSGQGFRYMAEMDWVLGGGGVERAIPWTDKQGKSYQICDVWQRTVTDQGVPFIRHSLVHQAVPDEYGLDEVSSPPDGKLPFFEVKREHHKSLLWESRGLATEAATEQSAIKIQFDARTDHTSLAVSPPLIKPPSLAGAAQTGRVRPGGELIEFRDGTVRHMDIRGDTGKSIEIERALWDRLARRFGRMDASVPPALTQLHMEVLVANVFTDLTEVLRHTVGLLQAHMPDLENMRVNAGMGLFSARGKAQALSATTAEIGGEYDVDISFDVRDMDLQWLREKASLLVELAIPLDSQAIIDRGMFVKLLLDAVDPRLEAATLDGAEAALNEEQDELMQLAIIVAGEEPPFVEQGQNHALRLQVLQRALQRSPRLDSIARGDQQVAAVLEARMKMHQQQVSQEENKVIGRQGAAQVLKGQAA